MINLLSKNFSFVMASISDYDFSYRLNKAGWKGQVNKLTDKMSEFIINQRCFAIVIYDNQKCTRRIYLNKEF